MRKETCKCGKVKERRHAGSCNACHSAYTKKWKKLHPLTDKQKENDRQTRRLRNEKRLEGKRQRRPRLGAKPGILRPLCSWCDNIIENFKKKNYCKPCAAKYNREWRSKNPKTSLEKYKDIVRSRTRYRINKGLLIKQPCEICGELKVEAHHEDYDEPFKIKWLCIKHHHDLHGSKRRAHASNCTDNERCYS